MSINKKPGVKPPVENCRVLPLLGPIFCGTPTYCDFEVEDYLPVPSLMVGDVENAVLLRVRGDAMSGEGIMPRDLVIVAPKTTGSDGDLVIVLLGEEALLGRLQSKSDGAFIAPSNPAYSPIKIWQEDSAIVGKVIGLLRDYEGLVF